VRPSAATSRCVTYGTLAITLTLLVYAPLLKNYFFLDDFLVLNLLVNWPLGKFLTMHWAGHLVLVRNAFYAVMHATAGANPTPYFAVLLALHAVNVGLVFAIVQTVTRSAPLACLSAAAWGTSPLNEGALGWLSASGNVFVATTMLAVLALVPLLWREQRLLFSAWNPFVTVLALACGVAAAADLATGRAWRTRVGLTCLVVPLSFGIQAHAGLVVPSAVCVLVAACGLARRAMPGDRPTWPAIRSGLVIATGVAAALWLTPLVAELRQRPGNLAAIVGFLVDGSQPRDTWARAVAGAAYGDVAWRPMADLDVWVRDADMPAAIARVEALGYRRLPEVPGRPAELQRRSGGEVVFAGPAGAGLLELHYSAFQGWWVRRTADPDDVGAWDRSVRVEPGRHARRLAPEDAILQTAFHVTVNQFGQAPLRGLLDIAVMARRLRVDWAEVCLRARSWRLETASGLVLWSAHALFGLGEGGTAVRALAPRGVRRALLRRFVTLESILGGKDLTRSHARHAFLLALVDRPRDVLRLVGRTLWPEPWWRAARYGRPVGPAAHLWSMARRGSV
jgi:hypothetical protein